MAEESDFAGRRSAISQLTSEVQDVSYYPRIGDVEKKLTGDSKDVNVIRIPKFRQIYVKYFKDHPDERKIDDKTYIVSGKIKSIRKAGRGSYFIDLIQDYTKLQLMIHHKVMGLDKQTFSDIHSQFRPGDQCTCIGTPGVTRVGELSLRLTKPLMLVSPALHPLPPKLTDSALINRNRVVDYLVNQRSQDVILSRAKIISVLRHFLENRGFIEVSTPIIGSGNSGANATPFSTSSVHMRQKDDESKLEKLNLRVAPELWLKKLIIGGFDKIYEVGPVFRNEGVDAVHNPEFTTCEFYRTFTTIGELMQMTEDLFMAIVNSLLDENAPKYTKICQERCKRLKADVDKNGGHFRKIDFVPELEKLTGKPLPKELTSESLLRYYKELNLKKPAIVSEYQLLDNLSSIYLEPLCKECPTFIYGMPEVLSPLAKSTHKISRRFEMYVDGEELVNAYEEENNPFKQTAKFKTQLRLKDEFNDEESLIPDYKYTQFMEWGMPPTGGWGMGIDRLTMLLTGTGRIDNVLTFGKLPDVLKQ